MSVSTINIPASLNLDPITVYVNDAEPGRGGIIVCCFGLAWSCFWGAMGGGSTVRQFLATSDEHYVANCLIRARRQFISSRKAEEREIAYLTSICAQVIRAVKEPVA